MLCLCTAKVNIKLQKQQEKWQKNRQVNTVSKKVSDHVKPTGFTDTVSKKKIEIRLVKRALS